MCIYIYNMMCVFMYMYLYAHVDVHGCTCVGGHRPALGNQYSTVGWAYTASTIT